MRPVPVILALLSVSAMPAPSAAEEAKLPPEIQARIDEANAKKAEAEALQEMYKAQSEAAKELFSGLPKSPATGTATLEGSGGKLESELLVASSFRAAAQAIAKDLSTVQGEPILVLPGSATLDRAQTMAFFAQAYGLEASFSTALNGASFSCGSNIRTMEVLPGTISTVSAALTALTEFLKSDVTVAGIDSGLTEATLVRAVAASNPAQFTTDFKPVDAQTGKVPTTLCRLLNARVKSEAALRALGPKAEETHPRELGQLTQVNAAYDGFITRLTAVSGDKPPLLAQIMAESIIDTYPKRILRLWTDAKGGTVIKRKSIWTMLGARSIGMTGGSVVSYMLTETNSGNVIRAGMLHCHTRLVSLRSAHKKAFAEGYCEPVTGVTGTNP